MSRPLLISRKSIWIVLALALAFTAGSVWVFVRLAAPVKTSFGWSADLTTLAGTGDRGRADGDGSAARFSDPFGLAIDPSGTVYVADAGETNHVRRVDPDGTVTTLPGQFETPSGLAIDQTGNIIVADTGANRIRKISPDGIVSTVAGEGAAGFRDGPANQARFNGPIGVAVAKDGTIYVADSYNDRIRSIDANGQVKTIAGGPSQGFLDGQGNLAAFNTPCGLIIDHSGAFLVADTGNDAIRRVHKDGRVDTLAFTPIDDRDGLLKAPVGLALSWDGFLYISSYRRGRIVQMSPSRALRVLVGRGATESGNDRLELASPAGLALDRSGALYVAEASRYAVRKLTRRSASATPITSDLRTAVPALVRVKNLPWPVAPQQAWHEVVGSLGEVRGNYQGESRDHLHAGLDIRAPVGETVLAIADEKVADPLPNGTVEWLSEGLRIDALTYIHMRVGRTPSGLPIDPARFTLVHDADGKLTSVRVKRGTRFRVGDPLGTINRMAHVHLELGPPGGRVNPLLLQFTGFTDHVAPRIEAVQLLDAAHQPLSLRGNSRLIVPREGGPLSIVVDAWDQVDGNAVYRRLGLYRAGFQILRADGRPVHGFERPRITLLFDRMPTDPQAVKIAYSEASGVSVHSSRQTRFLYELTNHIGGGRSAIGTWTPHHLAPGDYLIRIFAADFAGNIAQDRRDLAITVR